MRSKHRRSRRTRRNLVIGAAGVASFMAVVFLIPSILVNRFEAWEPTQLLPLQPREELVAQEQQIMVPVYLTDRKETVSVPLEAYVRGVLAAEMPADFELEALKAQAIAARTYLARRLASGETSGLPPDAAGALVTDTVAHQAYATEEELRERWGFFKYARNLDKLTRAVNDTEGLVLTYEGEPIEATFFSTSNGFTENSELYWQAAIPYLRSVESPWDERYAPNYEREASFAYKDFYTKLGLKASNKMPELVVERTSDSGRVLSVRIAGTSFAGREVREKLGLASTDFTWSAADGRITFHTEGYGHGVGMSQWGANGMAKEGRTAEEILLHYYQGVRLEPLRNVLAKA
ncbi:stage II sporulation protein D [Paenibacillus sp.]|uniref:stage II sporulation protein D n=1 Tax=Paenibacillus sp. TaxID=58172 RepID=UPI00281123C1|nr:stage II sporulation protein D [Paenibacillus sp.]